MCVGMKANKNLIGNLIVLLSERCNPLYHTKLLKLLFLIDEASVKKNGYPVTWLSYQVWQHGPVTPDVYNSKFEGQNRFSEFVEFKNAGENKFIIKPIIKFSDDEFSDLDLEIIEDVIAQYGHLNSNKLVDIVHAKGSLWHTIKERENLHFSEKDKTSNVELNFTELLDSDFKRTLYYSTLENVELQSTL